jgi:FkbM family methyltransferase
LRKQHHLTFSNAWNYAIGQSHYYGAAVANLLRVRNKMNYLRGRPFQVSNAWGTFDCPTRVSAMLLQGNHEPETQRVLRQFETGNLFVDVGANIGDHAVMAAKMGLQVIAIEPNREVYPYLVANCARNAPGVETVNAAAWSHKGILTFHEARRSDMGTMYELDTGGNPTTGSYSVNAITLDSILARQGRIPDLIKIDVEGAEPEVLSGLMLTLYSQKPVVEFEAQDEAKLRECQYLLGLFGYSFTRLSALNHLARVE